MDTGWPAASLAGRRRASQARCTSRATSQTKAGCSSTMPTRSCPQSRTDAQRGSRWPEAAGRCRERLRVRARRRRVVRERLRWLCLADLLGQLARGIRVPGSDPERRTTCSSSPPRSSPAGHRHGVRHLRRARLHAGFPVPGPAAAAPPGAAKRTPVRPASPPSRHRRAVGQRDLHRPREHHPAGPNTKSRPPRRP